MSKKAQDWLVYILECADNSLYTGITNDLPSRIKAHEQGSGAKYTKGRGPFKLVYEQPCKDKGNALKKELGIKALSRSNKIKLINTYNSKW